MQEMGLEQDPKPKNPHRKELSGVLTWVCKQSVKQYVHFSIFVLYFIALLQTEHLFAIIFAWSNRVQGGSLPYEHRPLACIEGRWCQ